MITPIIKDSVLKWLCLNLEPEVLCKIDIADLLKTTNLTFDALNSVLTYFQRIGFIEELNARRVAVFLILRVEASDFLLRGGFVEQEEILESNIKKLLLEIKDLEKQVSPHHLETVNKVSSIASTILSGLSFLHK